MTIVRNSADELLRILNDILDLSKIEAGEIELMHVPFDLGKCVRDAMSIPGIYAKKRGLKLSCRLSRDLPELVLGDSGRLRQILANLLDNAIKFTKQGEVELRVEKGEEQDGRECLHFSVRDTGVGIPKEKQEIVFKSTEQADTSPARKYGGTGLGLAISSQLVEIMGGRIWVESEVGKGSTFHFTVQLPAAERKAKPAPEESRRSEKAVSRLHILLVEDHEDNQKLATRILARQGHSIVLAENGIAAIEKWESEPFDIVLMDVQMPDMDGFEATQFIREKEKKLGTHTPIIAMTAYAMKGDRDKCLAAGMDDYISKPVKINAVKEALERWAKK